MGISMKVKGLGGVTKQLHALTGVSRYVNRAMAEETVKLIDEGFKQEQAPSGSPWKRRKVEQPWPILNKSGKLKSSWKVTKVTRDGFTVSSSDKKAGYHQGGTRNIPARPMIPAGGKFPSSWRIRLHAVALKTIKKVLGI